MPVPRVHLLRHGHSMWQTDYDITGIDPVVPDARLSERGRDQAAAVAGEVQRLGVKLIVTSPLTRAIETALGVVDPTSRASVVVDSLVRERLGDSCDIGRSPAELACEFPALDFGRLADTWWYTGPPDGRGIPIESRDRLAERASRFRSWLLTRAERSVLVVSHSDFIRQFAGVRLDNCVLFEWTIDRPYLLASPGGSGTGHLPAVPANDSR
ncbi:MAG: histidine phosphatase family protein [Dehalococcoidia bacterium]|nr:histidine phosphatase family protein [Dehalococcoidia bacterium]